MKTRYFTFGWSHAHDVGGTVFDRNIVVKITAEEPREKMFELFGPKWGFEYDEPPPMEYYPRGIFEINSENT